MQFFHSPLFLAVQQANIFPDSKTFADALPASSWSQVCALYDEQQPIGEALTTFVSTHFTFAPKPELEPLGEVANVREYIHTLWDKLARPPTQEDQGSLLALPYPYTVPGGRFNEIYYWDSYFTALGLIDHGNVEQVANMLDNFVELIEQFGHVPNGNRSYYVSRSQPPICALMVDLLWPYYHTDKQWVSRVCNALEREYAFWMAKEEAPFGGRVVVMPCGAKLNRYWDNDPSPRPESYKEDVLEAQHLSISEQHSLYRHLRAACESGWDFSSRWLANPAKLDTIRTCDIVPVDLNALMYQLETTLATCFAHLNNDTKSLHFSALAKGRKRLINKYFWNRECGQYVDWIHSDAKQSSVHSLATVVPMFVGVCNDAQALLISQALESKFLHRGGLVTTAIDSGQQWDTPNGWAPLQWFAVAGLLKYDHVDLAFDIAGRWLDMIEQSFAKSGCLLEKYNVCEPDALAGGGEYTVQQGFGWTNGVTSRFYELFKMKNSPDVLEGLFQNAMPALGE